MNDSKQLQTKLHPRNKHHDSYDFEKLSNLVPELTAYIIKNPKGLKTIDFGNPKAVLLLNKAILFDSYKLVFWSLPKNNLCPPIPGRADYIHYIADLLGENNNNIIPTGNKVKILDVGVGANLIYPIIGVSEYGWSFVGSEINITSLKNAQNIIENNEFLKLNISLRKQVNKRNILKNIVESQDQFNVVICTPPFFKSPEEVISKTTRKLKNLGRDISKPIQNFSGKDDELWCDGGEKAFITNYIYESVHFKKNSFWFTTLVSDKTHLKPLIKILEKVNVKEHRIIEMQQGNKTSRILAWRF
nr:23S rRNA (adenine(1618)-N(6))-methyltransferase RlmF [uncultured Flavobacterium sp.]